MNNFVSLQINSFFISNVIAFTKFFFYRVLFTKFIFFRSILLFLQYDIKVRFPLFYLTTKKLKKFTLLRSPHVHKKSRDQYELLLNAAKLVIYDALNVVYYTSFLSLKKLTVSPFYYKDCSILNCTGNQYVLNQ
jgi:hypothetical protein